MSQYPFPDITIASKPPSASIEVTQSDKVSLTSEELHELAILREHGKWAMTLITKYLNKQHGRNFTGAQLVQVWRDL